MSLKSIMVFKTTVQMVAQLHFDKKYLVELYAKNGLKLSDFEKVVTKSVDSMCAKGNPVGDQFLIVQKSSCG